MSVERLQERIRKTKNPTVLELDALSEFLPEHLMLQEGSFLKAYALFCIELMEALTGVIPAVRFSFSALALHGTEGLTTLSLLLDKAKQMGFYVLLDVPDALSAQRANANAQLLISPDNPFYYDGLILSSYIGSDGIKPYAARLEQEDKSLFIAVRTANRSAMELQDLLTGGRRVFEANTDVINRFQNERATKSGFDRIGIIGPATVGSTLKLLRQKYPRLFILVDGYDYSGANAKNCAEAADRLGHGVAVCAGLSICAAWTEQDKNGSDYIAHAVEAAQRIKKNLSRYFTVL